VRKELREIAGISALAVGAYLLVLMIFTGATFAQWLPIVSLLAEPTPTVVPFLNSAFSNFLCGVSCLIALMLGFRQSAWDHSRHTYLFLLHRPIARPRIFLVKIGTGLAILLASSGACIVAYAAWATTPGTHPGPFYWSMTENCWICCLGFSLVYLGAFLSGLRRARWFGTRLLPLVAGLLFFLMLWTAIPGIVTATVFVMVLDILMVIAICHVSANQDFSS